MPHARFDDLLCPWLGCGFQIWFIDFRLELQSPSVNRDGLMAWEQGPGLIGNCPSCGQRVLFGQRGKSCVQDELGHEGAYRLPADWSAHAILLDSNGNVISL